MSGQNNNNILNDHNKSAFEEVYRQHTGNFRTWLVAFGVGFPVFLVSNVEIWHKLETSGIKCILIPIIIGIALQVTLALVDKYADWFCLSVIYKLRDQGSASAKFGVWWQKHDWLSFIVDCTTILVIGLAAYRTMHILTP
jgi:hypothetical protein